MKVVLTVLALCLVLLALANFLTFVTESDRLGGTARNGYQRDGKFFVGERGRYTEVSEAAWRRSLLQTNTLLATHLLGMGGMAYLLFAWVFPALLGSGPREAVAAQVRLVEGEGRQLARARCGGRIGGLNFNGALTVTVFTSGLVIKPFLMQPLALTLAEIDTMRFGRNFWFRSRAIGH